MAEKKISGGLKSLLELGPIALFFAAYLWLKDETYVIGGTEYQGFIVVTALFIPVFLASIAALWWLTGHLSRMQMVTAVLIIIFGGLSVWFNDPRFFKMKPTIIYLLFGGVLAFGLLRGRSYLQSLMDGLMPLTETGWMILTRRLMYFFFGLAVLNEIVWRTMTEETWVYFKTFGLTAAIFLFFITQSSVFSKHSSEDPDDA